jgi:endonuclease YncB( thermonuclease family)
MAGMLRDVARWEGAAATGLWLLAYAPHDAGVRLLLLVLLLASASAAIEVEAVVVRIADGDTLTVAAAEGLPPAAKRGKGGDVYVRLLCVDTLEIWDEGRPKAAEGFAARDLLAGFAKPKTTVVLFDDGDELALDKYGRVLAFVRVGKVSAQEALVSAGLSAYWRRYRLAPVPLDAALAKAEAAARDELRGAWRTQAELMARKSAERPK